MTELSRGPSPEDQRRKFGFPTDAERISRAARGASGLDPYLGIPLTPAESAEMKRRANVSQTYEPLEQSAMSGDTPEYAGVFTDQAAGGIAVILATSDTPRLRKKIEETLPPGSPYEVRIVRNSLAKLWATEGAFMARFQNPHTREITPVVAGVHIDGHGVDEPQNVLRIEINAAKSVADPKAALVEALGVDPGALEVVGVPESILGVSRQAPTGRVHGGSRIGRPGAVCTATGTGYITGVNYWMVTAGHCGSHNPHWYQGWPLGDDLGFGHGNGFWDYYETWCDCQSIGPIPAKWSNKILDQNETPMSMTGQANQNMYQYGDPICVSATSYDGTSCGSVTREIWNKVMAVDTDRDGYADRQEYFRDQFITNTYGCEGDSGGPAYWGQNWAGIFSTFVYTFDRTTPEGFVVKCGAVSRFSRALPQFLQAYTGLYGMVTWL